jgi:hypothetical protein
MTEKLHDDRLIRLQNFLMEITCGNFNSIGHQSSLVHAYSVSVNIVFVVALPYAMSSVST